MSESKTTLSQQDMEALFRAGMNSGVGKSVKHESAAKHVSGEAAYLDDRQEFPNQLHLVPLLSPHAHAQILHIDYDECYSVTDVVRVITAADIPGNPDIAPLTTGDPLLADGIVEYVGQVILVVAATSQEAAREAIGKVKIDYRPLDAVLSVKQALEHYVDAPHQHQRGDSATALASAPHRVQGELEIGGQEHFYLETQIASVMPGEDGAMLVYSSTQHPTEVQKLVASVLGLPMHKVVVDMRRMGGGFGGKETQAAGTACLSALVAHLTGRPVKMRLSRQDDMLITGKRHPFYVRYDVGFTDDGVLHGIEIQLAANCGYSLDLSGSIVDRAMFHADNAYYLGDATITGLRCKTNMASNTAYRGFGGPQGMVAIEHIIDHIARWLGKDVLAVRKANYYGGAGRDITHYYQPVEQNLLADMTAELETSADYAGRRDAVTQFNQQHQWMKKGLALTPVKFGISFTASFLNQAGALVLVYTDGSILLNHGGTEMGQGLNTKVAQVVAEVFQVDFSRIQITATDTSKVPNTSPTAASSGADLNGKAAQNAAEIIKGRMVEMLMRAHDAREDEVVFSNGLVRVKDLYFSFEQVATQCWLNQVPLSATGFYKTPKIFYDRSKAAGHPFYYFSYGAACAEVLIDTLTGEYKLLRADILHDVGDSLNPAIDIGQVEGGFVQGMGWLTTEELVWNDAGRLTTSGPAGYKIPAIGDVPHDLRVKLIENRKNPEDTVFHSKAVGEPPFMLGISVWCALKDAVASTGKAGQVPQLDAPATPERVLKAITLLRAISDNVTDCVAVTAR